MCSVTYVYYTALLVGYRDWSYRRVGPKIRVRTKKCLIMYTVQEDHAEEIQGVA